MKPVYSVSGAIGPSLVSFLTAFLFGVWGCTIHTQSTTTTHWQSTEAGLPYKRNVFFSALTIPNLVRISLQLCLLDLLIQKHACTQFNVIWTTFSF